MRMKRLLLLSVAMTSLSSAATILTNTPAWNGSTTISPWGNSSHTPTYGETVTVPVNGDNVLSSFSFEIFGAGTPSLSFIRRLCSRLEWNRNDRVSFVHRRGRDADGVRRQRLYVQSRRRSDGRVNLPSLLQHPRTRRAGYEYLLLGRHVAGYLFRWLVLLYKRGYRVARHRVY